MVDKLILKMRRKLAVKGNQKDLKTKLRASGFSTNQREIKSFTITLSTCHGPVSEFYMDNFILNPPKIMYNTISLEVQTKT